MFYRHEMSEPFASTGAALFWRIEVF